MQFEGSFCLKDVIKSHFSGRKTAKKAFQNETNKRVMWRRRSRRHMEKARMYSWSVLTAVMFRISEIRLKFGTNCYRTIYFRRKLQQMKNANYGAPIALSGAAVWRLVRSVARTFARGLQR